MISIALRARIENHQYRWFKVENGLFIEITHDELADLYEAKRLYIKAVYEGVCRRG
ncbi:hypothetical protein M3898_000616 [Vibrio metschnikovii]|nr:hypothetical protein [Vibrio metschnikovii]EKO3727502.1 hypothetical protein [Vibrio metschnikovii]